MAQNRQSGPRNDAMASVSVRGWQNSKASSNEDGGVHSLKIFLEKKSSRRVFNTNLQGDALIVTVKEADLSRFTHLNGFTWAGTNLIVEQSASNPFSSQSNQSPNNNTFSQPRQQNHQPPSGPRGGRQGGQGRFGRQQTGGGADGDNIVMGDVNQNAPTAPSSSNRPPFGNQGARRGANAEQVSPAAIEQAMVAVIKKRYNASQKYLTLESLTMDPDFQAVPGFSNAETSKVFSALFVCCERSVFETPDKRREMIESLSLSNNSLTSVKPVIAASSTFSNIKNLDLSHNQIADISELRYWRNRFRNLEHLILSGNPIDLKQPETKDTMRRWYPKLRMYNNEPIVRGSGGNGPADLNNPANLQNNILNNLNNPPTPPHSTSPVYPLPTEPHPEFPEGSTFGIPQPGKTDEILIKEQMGLKFSYETRLKMTWVEQCLSANNFNYDAAMADLQRNVSAGNVPADAFLQVS